MVKIVKRARPRGVKKRGRKGILTAAKNGESRQSPVAAGRGGRRITGH